MPATRRVPPPPPAYLVLHHGDRWRDIVQLRIGAMTIGRDAGCDLCLASEAVSRRHARVLAIAVPGGAAGWAIEDCGSRHGVLIDGQRIGRRTVLSAGDQIDIGPYRLLFTDALDSLSSPPSRGVDDCPTATVDESLQASATLDPSRWQSAPADAPRDWTPWLSLAVQMGGIHDVAAAHSAWMNEVSRRLPDASIGLYRWPAEADVDELPPPSAVSQSRGFRYRRPPDSLLAMTRGADATAVLARQIQSSPLLASPDTAGNIEARCVLAVPIRPPGERRPVGLLHAVTAAGATPLTNADLAAATVAASVLGGWWSMHHEAAGLAADLDQTRRDNDSLRTQLADRDLLIRQSGGLRHQAADDRPMRTLAEAEAAHVAEIMRQTGGNKSKAATVLGIPRSTLDRKLAKHGVGPT